MKKTNLIKSYLFLCCLIAFHKSIFAQDSLAKEYFYKGMNFTKNLEYDKAILYFKQSNSISPKPITYYWLGYCAMYKDNWRDALNYENTAIYNINLTPKLGTQRINDAKAIIEWAESTKSAYTKSGGSGDALTMLPKKPKVTPPDNSFTSFEDIHILNIKVFPDPSKSYIIRQLSSNKVLEANGNYNANYVLIDQISYSGADNQIWKFEKLTGDDEDYYLIHPALNTGMCLDVYSSTQIDGGEIILFNCAPSDNQKWKLIKLQEDVYVLQAKHSGKVLDLWGSSNENHAKISQFTMHQGANQQWKIEEYQFNPLKIKVPKK